METVPFTAFTGSILFVSAVLVMWFLSSVTCRRSLAAKPEPRGEPEPIEPNLSPRPVRVRAAARSPTAVAASTAVASTFLSMSSPSVAAVGPRARNSSKPAASSPSPKKEQKEQKQQPKQQPPPQATAAAEVDVAAIAISDVENDIPLNFTGSYKLDQERSESIEPLLVYLDFSWALRRLVRKFAPFVVIHVKHSPEDNTYVQTNESTFKTFTEEYVLDGQERMVLHGQGPELWSARVIKDELGAAIMLEHAIGTKGRLYCRRYKTHQGYCNHMRVLETGSGKEVFSFRRYLIKQ